MNCTAGNFSFPAGVIPHQLLVEQTITICHGGREYLACNLDSDPGHQLVHDREKLGFSGICRLRRE
jgi:hypothetical protein